MSDIDEALQLAVMRLLTELESLRAENVLLHAELRHWSNYDV